MRNGGWRQATASPVALETIWEDYPMTAASEYHEPGEAVWVIYDLADPEQWSMAGQCVRCWGKERTTIHSLDTDRILVEFKEAS